MSASLTFFLVVLIAPILWFIGAYNRLVSLRNRFKNAFSQIDVQLKHRYDLIPKLIATAKTYMAHERATLEAVIAACNSAASARHLAGANPGQEKALTNMMNAECALGDALMKFFALAKAYPDLKANQNMMQLTEELSTTENKIAFARQAYNDAIVSYNTAVKQFPTRIIVGMFSFGEAQVLQPAETEQERKPVKVSL